MARGRGRDDEGVRHIPINGHDGAEEAPAGYGGDRPLRRSSELAEQRAEEMLRRSEAEVEADKTAEPGASGGPAELAPAAELFEKLKRARADFANYQRRIERERESWVESGKRQALAALLPAFDQLDITVRSAEEQTDYDGLRLAVGLVRDEVSRFLAAEGAERIEALGKTFDPEYHEALFSRESDEVVPGMVLEEIRPGFLLGGKVLRPSQVVVSAAPQRREEADGNSAADAGAASEGE